MVARFPAEVSSWLGDADSQRLLLTVGAVAFAVECLLLARIPPVDGFENYIVAAYPPEFWFLFTVGLTTAVLVFVGSALSYSGNWRYAAVLLAVNYGTFFLLPTHRGYALYDRGSADALGHLGLVKQLLQTDALPAVFYPAEHLLLSTMSVHGVSLPAARYLFEFGFTLLFIGSVGILVRELVGDERGLPAGLAAATPLVFMNLQVRIHPAVMSVLLFPAVMFLLERMRRFDLVRFRVFAVLLGLFVVFFHPVTTGLLAVLVGTTLAFQRAYDWYCGATDPIEFSSEGITSLRTRLASIVLVVGVAWYSTFGRTERAFEQLVGGTEPQSTIIASQAELAQEAGLTATTLAVRFLQKYGALAIYAVIAAIFGLLVLRGLRDRRGRYADVYVVFQALVGVVIALAFLSVYLLEFDPTRVSRYLAVMVVVVVGLLLGRLTTVREGARYATVVALTLAIIAAAVLGTFAGTTYWPNQQMTHAEYEGAEFVLDRHDTDHRVRTASLTIKTQWYITGNRKRPDEPPAFRPSKAGYALPAHLGYAENDSAGRTFRDGSYLVTHAYDLRFDESAYFTAEQQRQLGVYNETDVGRLDRDETAHKVYTNGGFTFWQVSAAGDA